MGRCSQGGISTAARDSRSIVSSLVALSGSNAILLKLPRNSRWSSADFLSPVFFNASCVLLFSLGAVLLLAVPCADTS